MGWCDWRRQPGIRIIFNCAFGLNLVSLLLLFISFVTPYWVISWPRVFSGFKRVGLWEACFAGMVIPRDVTQKAYHGCWWILAPEYYPIRDWLMPPWFVFTQVIVTFLLFAEIAMCIVMLVVWGKTMGQEAKERWPWGMVMASLAITVITALLKSIAAIIFGVAATTDISWMPRPELNYLSWSYGLFLVSCFMSIFATMAMVCVRNLAKEGYTATDQTDSRKRYPPPASSLFRPPSQSLGEAMPPESMVSNPPPRSDRPPSTGGYQTGYQQEGLYPQGGYGYPQEKQAPIGGYGYQPQQGGYQPQQGGYQTQQGGYQPQQVGYQPQQVGFQTQDPYPQKKKMDTTL